MADTLPTRSATDLFSDPIDSRPLWFNRSSFLQPEFDSEAYIADLRTLVSFDTLRSELQTHLASLKHELVDLINRDYADFVNLSTKLIDVDGAIVRMRAPLMELRDKILGFRESVESTLVAVQNGLRQRSEASAAREILELLLDTFHVVSKVRNLRLGLMFLSIWWLRKYGGGKCIWRLDLRFLSLGKTEMLLHLIGTLFFGPWFNC